MVAHIAAVTDIPTPTLDVSSQQGDNTALPASAPVAIANQPPVDEASVIDAQERAVAEQTATVIMGQIQQLEAELAQADPEEKGDILSMISNLSGIHSTISSALTSGDGKALTRAMTASRGAAINNALDETDEKDTFAGEQADQILAESDAMNYANTMQSTEITTSEPSDISAALQARDIMNFSKLDSTAQGAIAGNAERLLAGDKELSTLFTTQELVQNDAALQAVFERVKTNTDESLKTVQTIAGNTQNEGLQRLADELTALREQHGVQHAWLPATLNSLSKNTIDAQTFLDTATRYIAEEHVALDAMAQKAYAVLPDSSKHIMHEITKKDCTISDMVGQLDAYKKDGFLDTSIINAAFSHIPYDTDAIIQTLVLFDSGINLQQSLLNMQMHYVNMPDDSKQELATAMQKNTDSVFENEQPLQQVLAQLDALFTGRNIEPIVKKESSDIPPTSISTQDVMHEGKLEQEQAQQLLKS